MFLIRYRALKDSNENLKNRFLLLSFYYTVYYNGNENNILIAKRGTDYICGI